jgi:Na+/proline symporter
MWAFVGKTPKVSSNAMLSVLCGSYYNVLPFIAGLCMAVGVIVGNLVVPAGLSGDAMYAWFSVNFMSTGLGVLVLVGLLMTIISCGSSFAMNGVTILTRDIYQKCINKNATDAQSLFASRMSLIVVVVIGIAGALWLPILVPLWSLALALVISGLLVTILSAWFWKRSTTAGAMASTILGGLAAFGWAMYAWVTTGNPGAIVPLAGVGLHAAHVGLVVAIPAMIIGSLATKADYSKAKATSYTELGKEMLTSNLVEDKQTKPGMFGWLGAETAGWKVFWVVEIGLFIVHYLLSFFFHIPVVGFVMVWTSLIVGVLMIFMTAFLGGRDLVRMVQAGQEVRQTSK